MRVIVFAGPTISKDEILEILPEATVLPPTEQGDVEFERFTLRADVILLIDRATGSGCRSGIKEILQAVGEGRSWGR
jgi:hypothetical protein